MTVENGVLIVAGTMILNSLGLYWAFGPYALLLTGFVGVNLIQSALTGFCPAAMILKKILPPPSAKK